MGAGRFLALIPICICLMYGGNLLGILVNTLVTLIPGVKAANPVATLATAGSLPLKLLFLVVLAPTLEELVFRKLLIDRMREYGGKAAVVTSALMFGLFHGNLSQFFYAAALGLLFGWVYLSTGKLRWTVLLHMTVNFLGSVVGPALLERANLGVIGGPDGPTAVLEGGSLGGVALLGLYGILMIGLAVTGLVLLLRRCRSVRFEPAPQELPGKQIFSTVWLNPGMLLFAAGCLAMFLYSMLG